MALQASNVEHHDQSTEVTVQTTAMHEDVCNGAMDQKLEAAPVLLEDHEVSRHDSGSTLQLMKYR